MREIKFRAWNNQYKKMSYDPDMLGAKTVCEYFEYALDRGFYLMQYTGLKDKNGKEIYEGDIIRFFSPQFARGQEWGIGRIYYSEKQAAFELDSVELGNKCMDCAGLKQDEIVKFEVLGNIYENPELIRNI